MIKKITIILILCVTILLTGCESNELNIGTNINNILTKLQNTVINIDTIDNNYILNPDMQQIKEVEKSNIISIENNTEVNYNTTSESNTSSLSKTELIENLPYFTKNNNTSSSTMLYHFSEENFTPENLKYNPRYISTYNKNNTSQNLNNYIYKIQKLYAISEDVVEANNMLNMYQKNTISFISDIKQINNELIDLNRQPTNQKIMAINNYLNDLKQTTKRLKACNGDLNNEITNIISKNTGIINSIEIMNSNYIKILNHIDTRINYFENALTSLEQLKFIIEDSIIELKSELNSENNNSNINTYKTTNTKHNDIKTNDSENNLLENNFDSIANTNIDTYKDSSNNQLTETEIINTQNYNSDKSATQNYENNSRNNINTPQNNTETSFNKITNSSTNNTTRNNQNGIINENNINNENNQLYYYDNEGNLYNSKNNNYAFNNAQNNTNVDTYDYNSLIDVINRGTIDNGINTLKLLNKITLKPVMVNTCNDGANNETQQ